MVRYDKIISIIEIKEEEKETEVMKSQTKKKFFLS